MSTLWAPANIAAVTIPNRVVMSPTVKFCLHDGSGYVPDSLVEHYRLRAASGTGLIIVEATSPTEGGKLHEKCLSLASDDYIPGHAKMVEAIHAEGSKAFLQLCYTGISSKAAAADPTSASPEYYQRKSGLCLSHALTAEEIKAIELAHQEAAKRAVKAGYDGLEIHCSHEKLYGRFFDTVTNHRTDEYGGSAENRARIFTETLALIRQVIPAGMPVGLRMGVNTPDLESAFGLAKAVEAAGVDYIHFSKNFFPAPERSDKPQRFLGSQTVYDGAQLRRHLSVPVMLSCGITTPEEARYLMDEGYADFVSLGRGLLADYDWTRKARAGEDVDVCRHCKACQWRIDAALCPAGNCI